MLYKSLFRRALAINFTSNTIRSTSAMASSPRSFTLDRSIFNETLYSRVRDFWFGDLPETASTPSPEAIKTWYGAGKTPEQKQEFDSECHENFGYALKALGRDRLTLPAFEDYEKDIQDAENIASPLLTEVKEAQAQDTKKGSNTLLSLILLLDQMPRNMYRDIPGLKLVYGHYDRLAFTLLHSSLKLSPNSIDHESMRLRYIWKSWYLMPLMHSEHIASHGMFEQITKRWRNDVAEANDTEAVDFIATVLGFEEKHMEPLRKFGRYPHRNEAMGRQSTKEETEYLKSAETFGVKQQQKEPQEIEKSEL